MNPSDHSLQPDSLFAPLDLHNQTVEALRELGLSREAGKLEECGRTGYPLICEQGHRVFVRNRCDLRICLDCCGRFGKRLWARFAPLLREARKRRRVGYGLKFLTLTKRNTGKTDDPEELRQRFRKFFKDVRKLMNQMFPKSKGCGAIAVLEVTKNFTIHCHAIVYGPYVKQDEISDLWLKITGDSPVAYIQDMRSASVSKPLGYILKYILKGNEFTKPKDVALYLAALKGVRRVHTYGIFYNYTVEENEKRPSVCPYCGSSLSFDKDFYFEFGAMNVSFLRFWLGIEPLMV